MTPFKGEIMKHVISFYLNGSRDSTTINRNRLSTIELIQRVTPDKNFELYTVTSTNKNGENHKQYKFPDIIEIEEDMRINIDRT